MPAAASFPPQSLSIALKEWSVLCDALAAGRQLMLLRKGGILDSAAGFEPEHPAFLLFPTFVHQNAAMLKPPFREGLIASATEPSTITLAVFATVHAIHKLTSRDQMYRLDDQHIWSPPLIDMRFNYRPKNPLYLLVLRAWRLRTPAVIDNSLTYAGCMSWVPLDLPIDCRSATPAVTDADFVTRAAAIAKALTI